MKIIEREQKERGILREPLDPDYLVTAGLIDPAVELPGEPAAGEAWSRRYRIYFNRGSWGNDYAAGIVELRGEGPLTWDGMSLSGYQLMIDGGSGRGEMNARFMGQPAVERLDFRMEYEAGRLVRWRTRHGMVPYHGAAQGKVLPATLLERSYEAQGRRLNETIGGRRFVRSLSSDAALVCDWDMLLRIRSWPFSAEADSDCVFLEELSVPRYSSSIHYAGRADSAHFGRLHALVLQGEGIVPIDLWLNEERELILMLSGSFAEGFVPEEMMRMPLYEPLEEESSREVTFG